MVWDWLKRAWGGIKPILTRYVKPILTKVDEYASYIPEYSAIRDTVAKTGR
jgi:hypothetical protein